MTFTNHFTQQTVDLDHTHTQKFGGFFTYGKLIFSSLSNSMFKSLTTYQKIHTLISFIIIGFFKSFLCPFKVVEKLKGIYIMRNIQIDTSQLKKTTIIYFLFIPIWFSKKRATMGDLLKRKIIDESR